MDEVANSTDMPRERMLHSGAQALADYELLAILLRTGSKGSNVLEFSRELLRVRGGLVGLFNSRAYNEIRGFDEGYFLYIEDVDICSRLCLAGWSLAQVADTRVVHDARKQSHRSLRFTRWHIGGMLRYGIPDFRLPPSTIDRYGEAWLHGANIPVYAMGTWTNHAPTRKRKLLLHKQDIFLVHHFHSEDVHNPYIPKLLFLLNGKPHRF